MLNKCTVTWWHDINIEDRTDWIFLSCSKYCRRCHGSSHIGDHTSSPNIGPQVAPFNIHRDFHTGNCKCIHNLPGRRGLPGWVPSFRKGIWGKYILNLCDTVFRCSFETPLVYVHAYEVKCAWLLLLCCIYRGIWQHLLQRATWSAIGALRQQYH